MHALKVAGVLAGAGVILAGTALMQPSRHPPAAPLEALAFLEGRWVWQTPSGPWVETWNPPVADAMIGTLQAVREDETFLYEFFTIRVQGEESEQVVRLDLRHFHPGLMPWDDEKDAPRSWTLDQAVTGTARFSNEGGKWPQHVEYRRQGDRLTARLSGIQDGEEREFVIAFQRQAP